MTISIITVVYNKRDCIEGAVKSVLSQTCPQIEYIVVDGASTDGTQDIIAQYRDKIAIYISEKDDGIFDAMNKGIDLAKGDIVGFLNSDDIYYNSSVIQKVYDTFQSDKTIQACYGDILYFTHDLNKTIRHWRAGEYIEGTFQKGWVPPHPAFFVKKELLNKYGYFKLNFPISADYELMLRLIAKHNIKIKYIPEVITKMWWGGNSSKNIKNIIYGNLEKYRSFRENNIRVNVTYFLYNFLFKLGQLK